MKRYVLTERISTNSETPPYLERRGRFTVSVCRGIGTTFQIVGILIFPRTTVLQTVHNLQDNTSLESDSHGKIGRDKKRMRTTVLDVVELDSSVFLKIVSLVNDSMKIKVSILSVCLCTGGYVCVSVRMSVNL